VEPAIPSKKYTVDSKQALLVMGSDRPIDVINLLSASYAKSSWSKLVSAMNAVQNFASEKQSNVPFPISQNNLLNFVAWGHTVKKWKSSTISSYVILLL